VGDLRLFYAEAGQGDCLLLLTGLGGDHLAWAFQLAPFAARYRVVAFDNRGAGQSDAPDVPYSTRLMAEDALGLLDALGIPHAHVLGVSLGGMIAQELALAAPHRVRSLHLGCTLARPDPFLRAVVAAWREVRTRLDRATALRAMAPWLFAPATYNQRPEVVERLLASALTHPFPQSLTGFLRQVEAVQGHDTRDRLGEIRCPTLVSVGADDMLVGPRFARELADGIPGAALVVVPEAGHVYFWERPEVFNALQLDFLDRVATRRPEQGR
jgi:pimeloyl-ACP methyl ester carboxylesterase